MGLGWVQDRYRIIHKLDWMQLGWYTMYVVKKHYKQSEGNEHNGNNDKAASTSKLFRGRGN